MIAVLIGLAVPVVAAALVITLATATIGRAL